MLARSGEITAPCPVPLSLTLTTPSSSTPALSHFWTRRMMRLSPILCSTNRMSHSWLTVSKNDWMSASKMKFTFRLFSATTGAAAPSCDFRTIQVYPKDLRALPGHPEPAVSWHGGFRGGAHVRPKTTSVHHAAWRHDRVAARCARAAGRRYAAHRRADAQPRGRGGGAGAAVGVPAGTGGRWLGGWAQPADRLSLERG